MAGWQPIATAPREPGRPLLLYPRPRPRGSSSDGPLLDLTDTAVRRMIKVFWCCRRRFPDERSPQSAFSDAACQETADHWRITGSRLMRVA
jgi:hypothetical protein